MFSITLERNSATALCSYDRYGCCTVDRDGRTNLLIDQSSCLGLCKYYIVHEFLERKLSPPVQM